MGILTVEAAANEPKLEEMTLDCVLFVESADIFDALNTGLTEAAKDATAAGSVTDVKVDSRERGFGFTLNTTLPEYLNARSAENAVITFLNFLVHEHISKTDSETGKARKRIPNVKNDLQQTKDNHYRIKVNAEYVISIPLTADSDDDPFTKSKDQQHFRQVVTKLNKSGDDSITILNPSNAGDNILVSVSANSSSDALSKVKQTIYNEVAHTTWGDVRTDTAGTLDDDRKYFSQKMNTRTMNDRVVNEKTLATDIRKMVTDHYSFVKSLSSVFNAAMARMQEYIGKMGQGQSAMIEGKRYGEELFRKFGNVAYVTAKAQKHDMALQLQMMNYILRYVNENNNTFNLPVDKINQVKEMYQKAAENLAEAKLNKSEQRVIEAREKEFEAAKEEVRLSVFDMLHDIYPIEDTVNGILSRVANKSNDNKLVKQNPEEAEAFETNEEFEARRTAARNIKNELEKEYGRLLSVGHANGESDEDIDKQPFSSEHKEALSKLVGDVSSKTWGDVMHTILPKLREDTEEKKQFEEPAGHVEDRTISTDRYDFTFDVPDNSAKLMEAIKKTPRVDETGGRAGIEGWQDTLNYAELGKEEKEEVTDAEEKKKLSPLYQILMGHIKNQIEDEAGTDAAEYAVSELDDAVKTLTKPVDRHIIEQVNKIERLPEADRAMETMKSVMDEGQAALEGRIPAMIMKIFHMPGTTPEEAIKAKQEVLDQLTEHYQAIKDKYTSLDDDGNKKTKIPHSTKSEFGGEMVNDAYFYKHYGDWKANIQKSMEEDEARARGEQVKTPILNADNERDQAKKEEDREHVLSIYQNLLTPLDEFLDKYKDVTELSDVARANYEMAYNKFKAACVAAFKTNFNSEAVKNIIYDEVRKRLVAAEEIKDRFDSKTPVQESSPVKPIVDELPDASDKPADNTDVSRGQAYEAIDSTKTKDQNQE